MEEERKMSWTKKQLIEEAFDTIGIATHSFPMQPEQYASALKKLDSMMATWNGEGIRLGYPLYSDQNDSDIDELSNIPDWSYEAVYQNLALRIAPSFGKVVMPDLKQNAKDSYDKIITRVTRPPEMQITGLPKGQGHKGWNLASSVMLDEPTEPLTDSSSDTIDY